jgi:hypothetical protein
MRITEAQLRRIIREELKGRIDEMPWAGHIGYAEDERYEGDDDGHWHPSSTFAGRVETDTHGPGAKRFAMGKSFERDALRLYANLPFKLWTAPYVGAGYSKLNDRGIRPDVSLNVDDPALDMRNRVLDMDEGLEKLADLGYDVSKVGPDDLVILYTTAVTDKDYLGTPWMLMHAMFDSGSPEFARLVPSWEDTWRKFSESFVPWMTMKSARQNNIFNPRDAAAEAMAQELVDRRGFHLAPQNKRGRPPSRAVLSLIDDIKKVADEFRSNAPGHVITVVLN